MTRNYRNHEERAATIAGLRELADYLESHPQVPLSRFGRIEAHVPVSSHDVYDTEAFAEADRIAALVDRTPACFADSSHYGVVREFGPAGARVVYQVTAISSDHMARYRALNSYNDCVQPEEEEHGYEHV